MRNYIPQKGITSSRNAFSKSIDSRNMIPFEGRTRTSTIKSKGSTSVIRSFKPINPVSNGNGIKPLNVEISIKSKSNKPKTFIPEKKKTDPTPIQTFGNPNANNAPDESNDEFMSPALEFEDKDLVVNTPAVDKKPREKSELMQQIKTVAITGIVSMGLSLIFKKIF